MQHIPLFKIRCSAIHHIMGGALTRPTEKQLAELVKLEAKSKLTYNDEKKLEELKKKRDSRPCLQAGAKTYCEQWLKSKIYEEEYDFSSKYTEKGTECENDGINLLAESMNYGFISKNKKEYENDFCTGTPDLVLSQTVEDIKVPYTSKTFPLFEPELPNSDYMFQLQGYMWLTGKSKAAVNYCLINAPMHIIEMEASKKARQEGLFEVPTFLSDFVEQQMTYDNVPMEYRLKRYEFERNDTIIEAIERQVILCREYIASLIKSITKDKTSIILIQQAEPGIIMAEKQII